MRSGAVIKLSGYIALDTFTNRTNSHFADKDGNVICKAKCRFGYDCHTEIKFVSTEEFYTDINGTRMGFWKNHLPFEHFITCKNCQKRVGAFLKNYSTPTEPTESKTKACTNLVVSNSAQPENLFEALMNADLGRCD